jgi:hypothetical protein
MERNLLTINTGVEKLPKGLKSIKSIASLNDIPVAIHERIVNEIDIPKEAHYVLIGKDKNGKDINLDLFEDYRNKNKIPPDIRLNSEKYDKAPINLLSKKELQEINDIFWPQTTNH